MKVFDMLKSFLSWVPFFLVLIFLSLRWRLPKCTLKGEGMWEECGTATCLFGPLLLKDNVGKDQLWA